MNKDYKKLYKKEFNKFKECRLRCEYEKAAKHLKKSKEYYRLSKATS